MWLKFLQQSEGHRYRWTGPNLNAGLLERTREQTSSELLILDEENLPAKAIFFHGSTFPNEFAGVDAGFLV
jgi:hypothetical protein